MKKKSVEYKLGFYDGFQDGYALGKIDGLAKMLTGQGNEKEGEKK